MKKNYFLSMLILLFATISTHAQTTNVGSSGSGGPFVGTWSGNDGLYYALNHVAANQGQNLVIYLSGTFTPTYGYTIGSGTYIIEGDGMDTTIVQAMTDSDFNGGTTFVENLFFYIHGGATVNMSNLSIQNTRSATKQAAIAVSGATTTFTNVRFKNNVHSTTNDPGTIEFANCPSVTIDGCIFDNNSGQKGSAVYAYTTGAAMDITVKNSTFKNNVSTVGDGAVFMWTSNTTNPFNTTFGRNVFFNNTAATGASAIGIQSNITSVNLINNTSGHNTGQHGIILYGDFTSLTATNNLLYDNSAGYDLALSDAPTNTRNINNNFIRNFQETDLENGETSNILNTADAYLATGLTDNHLVPFVGSAVFDAGIVSSPYTDGIPTDEIVLGAYQGEGDATLATDGIPDSNLEVVVYPNPASSTVHVVSKETSINSVYLFDVLGQIVKTVESHALSATLDVSGLPAGVYILQTSFDGNTAIKTNRIVKQ